MYIYMYTHIHMYIYSLHRKQRVEINKNEIFKVGQHLNMKVKTTGICWKGRKKCINGL